MVNIVQSKTLSLTDKIYMMQEDAKFDVADAKISYGDSCSDDENIPDPTLLQVTTKGIAHTVPKVFMSNQCSFNCAYCGCRASMESASRYCNSPRELAEISVQEAKSNGYVCF